jgi:hypothetical protein
VDVFIRYKLIINYKFILNFITKEILKKEELPNYPFLGVYTRNPDIPLKDIDVDYLIKEKFEGYTEPRGLIDAAFLDSIVNFSHINDLELYLVGMPVSKQFYEKIPRDVILYTNEKAKTYDKYSNVVFINCLTFFDNEYLADYEHLTGKSSDKCSMVIEKLINN